MVYSIHYALTCQSPTTQAVHLVLGSLAPLEAARLSASSVVLVHMGLSTQTRHSKSNPNSETRNGIQALFGASKDMLARNAVFEACQTGISPPPTSSIWRTTLLPPQKKAQRQQFRRPWLPHSSARRAAKSSTFPEGSCTLMGPFGPVGTHRRATRRS